MDTELVKGSEVRAEGSEVRAEGNETRKEGSSKRAGEDLQQESIKKQKVDKDKETTELHRLIEVLPDKEDVAIDAIPLETKPLSIVEYKIHKEGKKTYLETLWKLVKAKHGSTRPGEGYERVLWGDLKTMFDPHVEDQGRIVGIKRLHDDLEVTAAKVIDYSLWEVIENGNAPPITKVVEGVETTIAPTTAKEKAQRRLELKARSTLLMGIPNEHQLKFNSIKDAKSLLQAVKKRFGGNDATKKTQRNLLKEQYENFTASCLEVLDQIFDRLHKLISYTNEAVNTAHGVSAASSQANAANPINVDNLSDAMIYDLEEMDLRWQMAMLTMRVRRFLKNTRRKVTINGNETIGFDKSKVECYNCHKRGHFARECRVLRNQDNKNRESSRRSVPVETTTNALILCDGLGGVDMECFAGEGPTNYALMAYSSSSSDFEVSNDSTCSKSCLETIEVLKSKYEQLLKRFEKSKFMGVAYKTVNAGRPMSYLSKTAHSTIKRPINKNTTFKNSNFNQRVDTVKDKNVNIVKPKAVVYAARLKAVVNAVKRNNVVKASACWGWKPQRLKSRVSDGLGPKKLIFYLMSQGNPPEKMEFTGYNSLMVLQVQKASAMQSSYERRQKPCQKISILSLWPVDHHFSKILKEFSRMMDPKLSSDDERRLCLDASHSSDDSSTSGLHNSSTWFCHDAGKMIKDKIDVVYKGNVIHESFTKTIEVDSAWKPPCCSHCRVFSHDEMSCKLSPKEKLWERSVKGNENVENPFKVRNIGQQARVPDVRMNNGKVEYRRKQDGTKEKVNGTDHMSKGKKENRVAEDGMNEMGGSTSKINKKEVVNRSVNRFTLLDSLVNKEDLIPTKMKRYYKDRKELFDVAKELEKEEDVIIENPDDAEECAMKNNSNGVDRNIHVYDIDSLSIELNFVVERKKTWRVYLVLKIPMLMNTMVIMRDFNVTLRINEHSNGSSIPSNEMIEFQKCIGEIKVEDILSSGFQFTCTKITRNPKCRTLKKLDMIMINGPFPDKFPQSHGLFLPYMVFIKTVLHFLDAMPKCRKAFRFSNFITEKKEFLPIVQEVWKQDIKGYMMYRVVKKMKMLKPMLKQLSWKNGNVFESVIKLRN
ncbi:ribonuclease H-like domain-containing protein [Tanacetum coccineum]